MSIGFSIDDSQLKKWVTELRKLATGQEDAIDYEKVLDMWSREVAREIIKKHSRRYSYVTPAATSRINLRRRSGKIAAAIKAGRYLHKYSNSEYAVVFDFDTMTQIAPHIIYHLDDTYLGTKHSDFYKSADGGYLYIPLRAALDGNGELAVAPPVSNQRLVKGRANITQTTNPTEPDPAPWHNFTLGYMWTLFEDNDYWNIQMEGEDLTKFHSKSIILSDHGIPYFVAAKTIEIPKRLKIGKEVKRFFDKDGGYGSLHGRGSRLDREVERLIRRLAR